MAGGVAFLVVSCAAAVFLAGFTSANWHPQVFMVGGEPRGWAKPAPHEEETYNHWAARNRFHVGDILHFKYDKNDSLLVVSGDDYKFCCAHRTAVRFEGGDTRYRIDHSGYCYFISDAPGHCDAGQRMAVRVLPLEGSARPAPAEEPAAAKSPAGGGEDEGGEFGPPWGSGSDNGGGGSKPGHGGGGSGSASGSSSMAPPHYGAVGGANGNNKTSGAAPSSSFGGSCCHVVRAVVLGAPLLSLVV